MNLPNKLTMLRIYLIPVFLIALLGLDGILESPYDRYVALGIFIFACLTDALDGYIARSRNLITNFGKFMDPLADKLLVISAFIAFVELGEVKAYVVVIIICRELMITGFRILAADQNIVIAASNWGKIKTIIQMITVIYLLIGLTGETFILIANILIILTVLLTVISGADYIIKNKEVINDR